jgi:hypothetical protein
VVPRWVSSGSISAVGERLAGAEAAEPLSVAQGLLQEKRNYEYMAFFKAGVACLGHVHVSIGPQCLPNIAVQRVDDDFLAAVAEAGVPRRRFVKEGAAVIIASNSL